MVEHNFLVDNIIPIMVGGFFLTLLFFLCFLNNNQDLTDAVCNNPCPAGKINDQECYIHGNKTDCSNMTKEEIMEKWLE